MNRAILRFLNSPILVFFTLLGVAIQTSFFTFWILPYLQPDLVLLIVLWCALRRSFAEGGVLTLLLANVAEIHSASPRGLYLITYMLIYLLVRWSARILVIRDVKAFQILTVMTSLGSKIFSLGIVYLLGISIGKWDHTLRFIIPGALMNGLMSQWIFHGLNRFDQKTYKTIWVNRITPLDNDEIYLDDEYQMGISEI